MKSELLGLNGPPVTTIRSRSEEVYAQLKQDITDFKFLPGDRFTESELSDRMGVSRTPIRQALHRLQQEGHLEVFFRSGWRVLPFEFKKYEQLYDLRMVLETEAVQRLCQQPQKFMLKALAELESIWLVPQADRSSDGKRVSTWDEEFHCSLVAATGNDEMARVHRDITEKIRFIRRLDFTQSSRLDATYDEHAKILKSILAHRADQACILLRAHISASQSEVKKITLHQMHIARSGT